MKNFLRKETAPAVVLSAAALAFLGGCGNGSNKEQSTASAGTPNQPAKEKAAKQAGKAVLTFDALGGGSAYIYVYPGVKNTAADKTPNGTFENGQSAPAECKATGRTVNSQPSVGEAPRTSDEWVKIQGTPGETQYATAVYARDPAKLLTELPEC